MPISNMTMMTVILKLLAARRIGEEGRMDGSGGEEGETDGGRERGRKNFTSNHFLQRHDSLTFDLTSYRHS